MVQQPQSPTTMKRATDLAQETKRMPQVGEFDINFSSDDEIKINVENLKKRVVFLKNIQRLSKEKDIYKQHVNNQEMIGCKVESFFVVVSSIVLDH